MHPRDYEQIGDEPLYCEAEYGSTIYSGSENDYYEAPETRRLRIEAKAVQFLDGNVPFLLSAKLGGPFDKESWTNPWRSKRAERRAQAKSGQTSEKQTVKSVEAARADRPDKATDDLPDTQKTNLYPLPSPETTNPPSATRHPLLDENEYNWIEEWRDVVEFEGTSSPSDPFRASQHKNGTQASSTKKRPANEEWLRKDEPKKRKPMEKSMTSPPAESPSRAAAQVRAKRIGRQSSILTQAASHSSNIASNVAFGVLKAPETTPNLSMSTGNQLGRQPNLLFFDTSEDELSMPSTTPTGRHARSPTKKALSPDCSPSWRRRQTKLAKKLPPLAATEAAEADIAKAEQEESHEPLDGRSETSQALREPARALRHRAIVRSQQDSSFCFHQLMVKSPLPEVQPRYTEEDNVVGPAASFEPSHSPHTNNQHYIGQPIDEQENHDDSDKDQIMINAHNVTPTPHKSSEEPIRNDDEHSTQSEQAEETYPRAESGSAQNETEPTKPEPLFTRTEEAAQSPPKASMNISNAEWSTYINTQDLSVVSDEPSQERQHLDNVPVLVQQPGDESDPDWDTVASFQDVAESASLISEAAATEEYPLVVEQGQTDLSESEWSTFLRTPNRSADSLRPSGSSVSRLETMDGVLEYDSDSAWSTCMSVSSQIEMDQTGDTSHEPSSGNLTAPGEKSPQCKSSSVGMVYDQETGVCSGSQAIMSMDICSDAELNIAEGGSPEDRSISTAAVHAQVTEVRFIPEDAPLTNISPKTAVSPTPVENIEIECTSLSDAIENDSSKSVNISASKVEQELYGRSGASQIQNPDNPLTDSGAPAAATTEGSRADFQRSPERETSDDLKTPQKAIDSSCSAKSTTMGEATTSTKRQQFQSPWSKDTTWEAHPGQASKDVACMINSRQAGPKTPMQQSPWLKDPAKMLTDKLPSMGDDKSINDGNSSGLTLLAGQALELFTAPQTPWIGEKLPSPDFSLSVKRFSDFMKPSPTKKRSSPHSSILRSPTYGSNILFGNSATTKPQRRVRFVPLPGEEAVDSMSCGTQDGSSVYVEDVSYFDNEGNKATTVRVTRPTVRPASPPPREVNSADVGNIPDYDQKFARHFEAMSKRKQTPPPRAPRLLPLDSPQTNGSQEIGAMAEAFIQASQTRRKGLELDAASVDSAARSLSEVFSGTDGQATPRSVVVADAEDQENAAPVDDVSAVLDNLDDFLDNTWGINVKLDEDQDTEEPGLRHAVQTAVTSQSQKSVSTHSGDPMWALNVNVWAD